MTDFSDMKVCYIQDSEAESYFSNCSSEERLEIDTSYFSQKSDNSELKFNQKQLSEVKKISYSAEPFVENNCGFECVSTNESFLQHTQNNLFVDSREYPSDVLQNSYFCNEIHSDLKISAVYYTLPIPQTNNLISPLDLESHNKCFTENETDPPSVARSENVIQETNNLSPFEQNIISKSVLKVKFDSNIRRPTPTIHKSHLTMEFAVTSENNSREKCRPKLRSIYLAKKKLRQMYGTLTETECQSNVSNTLESKNPVILDLQTNSINRLEKCSEVERENSKASDKINLQSCSTSVPEADNQSNNNEEIEPSRNSAFTVESDNMFEYDNMLAESLLLTEDALLKAAIPDTPVKTQSKEDSDFIKENILNPAQSEEESEFLNSSESSESNSDDSSSMTDNLVDFFSTQSHEKITGMLNAESSESNSDDSSSMTHNLLDFFSTQSHEEITEMLNATKFGSLKMTLRDRSPKKNEQREMKSSTIISKKVQPKRKVLPQTQKDSSQGIKKKKRKHSVKLKRRKSTNLVREYSSKQCIPESLACGNCDDKFPTWPQRIKHWLTTKHKVPVVCDWCRKSFYFIRKHIINTHPSMCENCGEIFMHPDDKIKHSEQHLNKKTYCCNECMHFTESENELRLHMEDHLGKQLYICEFCEEDFINEISLKAHLKRHHFECDICNFKCFRSFHFEEHMLKHKEKAPFSCLLCDKVYSNSKTLKYHVLGKHEKIKPYVCKICKKSFVMNYKLMEHLKRHEKTSYYTCGTCGQQFLEERYLISHEEDHNTFICNFCHVEYSKKINLISHLIGSAREGFMCQKCKLSFNCRTEYDKHMEMHVKKGDMTSICQFCDAEFKNNSVLKRHMIISHPKEYAKISDQIQTCKYCGHICSSRHHLLKHIRLKHPHKRK